MALKQAQNKKAPPTANPAGIARNTSIPINWSGRPDRKMFLAESKAIVTKNPPPQTLMHSPASPAKNAPMMAICRITIRSR
jgi:hypothetical protein